MENIFRYEVYLPNKAKNQQNNENKGIKFAEDKFTILIGGIVHGKVLLKTLTKFKRKGQRWKKLPFF